MSNEEAKMMLITMQGLITIACHNDNIENSILIAKLEEAVDIAIAAIDTLDMQIEGKKEE
jgi:hypothetical protein